MTATLSVKMQPRHFRALRRIVWTWMCRREYRRRLNGTIEFNAAAPWPESLIEQMAEASAQSESDSNDRDGYAWDSPADAVQNELECWTE